MHRSSSGDFTVLSRSFCPGPRFNIKTTHIGHSRIVADIPTDSSLLSTEQDEPEERNTHALDLKISSIFKKNSSNIKPLPLTDFSLNTTLFTSGLEKKYGVYGVQNTSGVLNTSIDNGNKFRGLSASQKRKDNEGKQSPIIKVPSKEVPIQIKKKEVPRCILMRTSSVGQVIKGRPADLVRKVIEKQSVLDSIEDMSFSRVLQDREKMYINTSGIRTRILNLNTERKVIKNASSDARHGSVTSREDEYLKVHLGNGLTREKTTQVRNLTLDQLKSRLVPKKVLVNAYEVIGSYGPRKRQI
jgi:hypothetical protein